MQTTFKLLAAAGCAIVLAGCAAPARPLMYDWGSYQDQVYSHFKAVNGSPEQEIAELEKTLSHADANHLALPPGFHAHLGYLYGEMGHNDLMLQQFALEKQLYPESAAYIDFLIQNVKRPA